MEKILLKKNFVVEKKITQSESDNYYLNIPNRIELSKNISLNVYGQIFKEKVGTRNRLYVTKIFRKLGLSKDKRITISRKNDQYFIKMA